MQASLNCSTQSVASTNGSRFNFKEHADKFGYLYRYGFCGNRANGCSLDVLKESSQKKWENSTHSIGFVRSFINPIDG